MRGSTFEDEVVVCWVLSEAARDGTPLKVEKRFEVRLDETWMVTSQRVNCEKTRIGLLMLSRIGSAGRCRSDLRLEP